MEINTWQSTWGYGLWHINRLMALSFTILMIYVLDALTVGEGRLGRWLVLLGQWSLPIYFVHYFFCQCSLEYTPSLEELLQVTSFHLTYLSDLVVH